MEEIGVVIWGLGAMGGGIGRVLLDRPGVRLAGAICSRMDRHGQDLGRVLGLDRDLGVICDSDASRVLDEAGGDVCIHATTSMVADVAPQILTALDLGYNVITIAEEMAYPAASDPGAAAEIDRRAVKMGKTVLGTGINPGFVLDTLILALTGVCVDVRSIRARRVNDLSPFGPTVMRTQGVGTTADEFEDGVAAGTIVGHIGFAQSIRMVAAGLGWELDRIEETREPIVAGEERRGRHIQVPAGMVAGCNHAARGYVDGREVITLEHPQQVEPSAAGVETGDFIAIDGVPGVSVAIQPEIPGGTGTIAVACNMLPGVLAAPPGLRTMADLPVPRAVLGDVRAATRALREQTEPLLGLRGERRE